MWLKVRTFFHENFRFYYVHCNLILGYICRITVNLLTLKDGSLLLNIFHQTIVLGTGNFPKWSRHFSKNRWRLFDQKLTISSYLDYPIIFNFASLWHRHLLWTYKWNFKLSMSAVCNGEKKYPIGTSIFYTDFCVEVLSCSHCCC